MARHFNLSVPRPGAGGKVYWQNIGKLFQNDQGNYSIKLDAIPVGEIQDQQGNKKPFDGWIKVFDSDNSQSGRQPAAPSGGGPKDDAKGGKKKDLDDEIPF